MGFLSRAKGRLKTELKRRVQGPDKIVPSDPSAPLPTTAGPEALPDPDVRPEDRDASPWFLDGELEGWEETNPDD